VASHREPRSHGVLQCLADLQAVGDVSTIQTVDDFYNCESVSNGDFLSIDYAGHTTRDLHCELENVTPAQAQMLSDCLGR